MRQALNNLQATFSGFRFVNQENVFKVNTQLILFCMFNICSANSNIVLVPGMRSTTSLACQEHGEKCAWWKVWRGLLCTEATLWFGILAYWHYHYSLPSCQELWHGWISEAGNAQGNFTTLWLFIKRNRIWILLCTALGLLKMQSISPLLIKIFCLFAQETGFAHMRICDGVGSFL